MPTIAEPSSIESDCQARPTFNFKIIMSCLKFRLTYFQSFCQNRLYALDIEAIAEKRVTFLCME